MFQNVRHRIVRFTMQYNSRMTPTDRATRCVTPSRHRDVHKAGRSVWSAGDGRRLLTTLGDDRRAVAKLFLVQTSEVGEIKSSRGNCAYVRRYSNFVFCMINKLQLQGALSPRPETLDPLEARPRGRF